MAKITTKDKHFWKIIAFILVILNIALLTILLGLVFEEKAYGSRAMYLEPNLFSKQVIESYFGNEDAPVTMIIYSDFECPYCKRFHNNNFKKLKEEYIDTGKLKVVFRHFPKTQVHKSALIEAQAFECAKEQNKSYDIYLGLYAEKRLSKTELLNLAQSVGIEIPQFEECLYLEEYKNDILIQKREAEQAGITITPTIIIDNVKIEGLKPYFLYKQIIDDELNIRKIN